VKTTLLLACASITLGASIAATSSPAAALRPADPAAQQTDKPAIQDEPRGMARVVYFGGNGIAAEYKIEYGKPAWKDEFDKQLKGRVRLGRDYWTTLDTWNGLTIGDKDVKAGEYFLALECSDKKEWSLVLLDPEPLRKQKFDAYGSAQTKGGQLVPMKHEETKDSAESLAIKFVGDTKDSKLQTLEIRFGKHRLTATVKPKA
jgi:hypothetical protein